MAGVRKKTYTNGKYGAWFTDYTGKQKFFIGTTDRKETLHMAVRLEDEHRQIRLGYREPPKTSEKHKLRPFEEIKEEYISWGKSQGGRRGKPWSKVHLRMRLSHLTWWQNRLGLTTMEDLKWILSKVEAALREIQKQGRSGKTLTNYAEALRGFCNWCVVRGYLEQNPLKDLGRFDIDPHYCPVNLFRIGSNLT